MLVADGRLVRARDGGYRARGDARRARRSRDAPRADRGPARRASSRATGRSLQDAAVLGQSVHAAGAGGGVAGWRARRPGAAAARARRGSELLAVELDPRSPERGQYAFVQALIREVAYSTLSLRDRRTRHLAAARYFEALGDEELAGALAAHYVSAYKRRRRAPRPRRSAGQARIALRAAAARAERSVRPPRRSRSCDRRSRSTTVEADRADLLEQAARTRCPAGRLEHGGRLWPARRSSSASAAGTTRDAGAMPTAWPRDALISGRQREDGLQMVEPCSSDSATSVTTTAGCGSSPCARAATSSTGNYGGRASSPPSRWNVRSDRRSMRHRRPVPGRQRHERDVPGPDLGGSRPRPRGWRAR